jgi:hypothetical protein
MPKLDEHPGLTYLLMQWLSQYASRYPDLKPEQILVSLERTRYVITETLILKRPFPSKYPPVERKRDLS